MNRNHTLSDQNVITVQPQSSHAQLGEQTYTFETGKLALLASGACTVQCGENIVLATASITDDAKAGADFLPLTIEYQEKFYAAGVIKGNRFQRREGKPTNDSILTSRVIDRPIRPLFPKGFRNEVQVIINTLSADKISDLDVLGINAASAALMLTGAPFAGPVGGVRVGLTPDGEYLINPSYEQLQTSQIDLIVAGTKDAVTMVEAGANEVSEEVIVKGIELAHEAIKKLCAAQEELVRQVGVEPMTYTLDLPSEDMVNAVNAAFPVAAIPSLFETGKLEFYSRVQTITDELKTQFVDRFAEDQDPAARWSENHFAECVMKRIQKEMRKEVLATGKRLDGRRPNEVRPIRCQVGVLPRPHGSALFQRGLTQILSVTTLGGPGDAMTVENADKEYETRFIHHYNFPPFATGEVSPIRSTSRREIGHGALAERALLPIVPSAEDFPYIIRLVSETMSCNGSTSMGSVCGSTLALMDAGVPIKRPVSGIAMGMIMDEETGKYVILSDIQAQEDFLGDMDFKVTGSSQGITALQLDTKIKGLSSQVLHEALNQGKNGREFILAEMLKTLPTTRDHLSQYAPMLISFLIPTDSIKVVIGKGGETIQKITRECGVEINIADNGLVTITADTQEKGDKAKKWIDGLTYEPKVGDIFTGKVTRLLEFGAIIQLTPAVDGLLHISQISPQRIEKVEDVLKEGDEVTVKIIAVDGGKISLSKKAVDDPNYTPPPPRPSNGGHRSSFR